ncbi:MAG: sigma-54-dependent Fis family transcriptional regulator [Desulfobacteraceae bacterium]|nr:sigma-54-dependent Fis family transcriptional regulator [Desulfobacteraceae bacterium]
MGKSKILVIDDDSFICKVLIKRFEKMNYEAHCSSTLQQGLDKIFSDEFDVLFLDVNLPDGNGIEAIDSIREHPVAPEIIIMTGDSDPESAELAMKSRAWDYIQKSGSHKDFKFSLIRALEYRQQKQSNAQRKIIKRDSIIGDSRQITACLEKVSNASNNDSPVLITGETGTGKELFAKAIHENSSRNKNDFIVVDCAALPEHLVESVLFGHSKGAFTSADSNKTGLLKLADKGTLFLDEVGELPTAIQKKFLRALQEKKYRPVGSKKEISSNFRLVAATHRDVSKMIEHGKFREDFYFRIASLTIKLSPLKDHKSDIALLVKHHMDRKKKLYDESPHKLSNELMDDLNGYNWPGNVRELFNTIDYACSDAFNESILYPKHLPDHIRTFNIKNKIKTQKNFSPERSFQGKPMSTSVETLNLKNYIDKMKKGYVKNLMSHTQGDIKAACSLSGLSRGHLYALLKEFDIRNQ